MRAETGQFPEAKATVSGEQHHRSEAIAHRIGNGVDLFGTEEDRFLNRSLPWPLNAFARIEGYEPVADRRLHDLRQDPEVFRHRRRRQAVIDQPRDKGSNLHLGDDRKPFISKRRQQVVPQARLMLSPRGGLQVDP